jgi:hypothetical protein
MLKFIYKFCLISVLSGSLLLLDFGAKGFALQAAFAAPAGSTNVDAQTSAAVTSGTQAQANNVQKESLKTGGGQDGDMMATLTMIVVGLVAGNLVKCKMTTDMMLAAAGGVIFIAGDIMASSAIKKAMKEMETEITRDKKGNINQEQIEDLQKLKESYEKAKKTANTKKMLQMAAAAAFTAAAVMAASLYMTERAAVAACTGALTAAGPACASMFAASCAGAGATCVYPFQAGGIQATGLIAQITSTDLLGQVPKASVVAESTTTPLDATNAGVATSAAAQCPAVAGAATACTNIMTVNKITKGLCPVPLSVVKNKSLDKGLYAAKSVVKPIGIMAFIEKYVLSSAQAFSMIGIASGAAVAFIVGMSKTIGLMVDQFMFSPLNRAIVWGVLAGLSYMASTATANVIKKIDGYIAQIDAILNGLKVNADGTTTPNPVNQRPPVNNQYMPTLTNTTINPNTYDGVDLSGPDGNVIPCLTTVNSGTCVSFEDASRDLIGNSGLSAATQAQIAGIMRVASGMNGTNRITGSTLEGASNLAGSANALRSNLDKLKKDLNTKIKLSGKTFEGESKKFADQLNKAVRDGLKKNNSNVGAMLASIGGAGMSSAVASVKPEEEAVKKLPPVKVNVVDIGAAGAPMVDGSGLTGLETGAGKELSEKERLALEEQMKASSGPMDQYDLKNDITKDSNSSIFELISHRYKTSGYQRLFKLKENK